METQLIENNLLELCNRMRSLIDKYINNHKPSTTITLLVGLTGAGKSTIFNFLCGAEYVYNGKHLDLKYTSDQFSIMKGGMVSVTKEPKFYMNNNNKHLLIDFPGFQDTTGNVDQLLFDLLFNKIVSMGEVKIIYVINNPDNTLPARGIDLQAFISQLDNPSFNLLLNCYNEDLDDEELINDIKEELKHAKFQSNIDKIIVQRKAKKDNLDKVFKDNHRQIFWNQIQAMNKVQIKPRNIPKSQLISEFLISEATKKIQENVKIMLDFFNRKLDETNQQQNEDMLANLKLFKELMQNDKNLTALQWFEQFINICEKLANQQQTKIGKDFISLFQYFEQFKEFINGYQQLQTINEFGKQAFKQIEILIDTKIELIEKLKQAEQERKKAEEERKKAEQERLKAEQEKQLAQQQRQKAEQERQRAEEDKKKAEQERQRAEQQRRRAEEDKKRAEQERQRAEEDKKRAEQERQRQQAEIDRLNRQYKQQEQKIRMQQGNLEEQQTTKMEFQQKQMQQESKRNLEEQQKKEIENKQIQEKERLKFEEEQKKLIKEQRESQFVVQKDDLRHQPYNVVKMRLEELIKEKEKYVKEQSGLYMLFVSGDSWQVYNQKIHDFDRDIKYCEDIININFMQVLNGIWS